MIEVAAVFTKPGRLLFVQPGSSAGSVDDSRTLWDVLWSNRDVVGGVAHTHPWAGPTGPSGTDVTTFKAIESGLGRRLIWPIVTFTHVNYFTYHSPQLGYVEFKDSEFRDEDHWYRLINTLRFLSQQGENT